MTYFLFIIGLSALHFPIYRKRIKTYVFMFLSLFLIITLHIRFIYSLTPEYWKNINDEIFLSTHGPDTAYYMTYNSMFFYAFIVSWLSISLLTFVELILNKIQKTFINIKTVQIANSFIIAVVSIYFLIYNYFIDDFIHNINRPGFEFFQHSYLFFVDVLLFVLAIKLTWYQNRK